MENKEGQLTASQDKDSTKKVLVALVALVVLLSGALSFVIVKTGFLSKYLPNTSSECSRQIQEIEGVLENSSEIPEWKKNVVYRILTNAKKYDREGEDILCFTGIARAWDRLNSP